jgi:hypothetical protein
MSQSDRLAIVVGDEHACGTAVDDRLLHSTAAHGIASCCWFIK